jgi:xylose isomerase
MTVIDLPKCIPNRFRLDFDVGLVIGFAKTWELNADIRVQKGFPRNFDKNYLFNNPRFMDLVAVCTNEKIDLVFQID